MKGKRRESSAVSLCQQDKTSFSSALFFLPLFLLHQSLSFIILYNEIYFVEAKSTVLKAAVISALL